MSEHFLKKKALLKLDYNKAKLCSLQKCFSKYLPFGKNVKSFSIKY